VPNDSCHRQYGSCIYNGTDQTGESLTDT